MARNTQVDVARGMVMLYIIAIVHGVYWLDIGSDPEKSLILFEMPCIFFIAGYSYALFLQAGARMETSADYLKYSIQRAGRILIPYWCYAAVCAGVVLLQGDPRLSGSGALAVQTIAAWFNPLAYARSHTIGVLNAHLWFVAPFLGVSLIVPLLAKAGLWYRFPLWLWIAVATLAIALASHLLASALAKAILTYSIWSMFGYAAAVKKLDLRLSRRPCIVTLAMAVAALALIGYLGLAPLDMQANKFPPNATFFIFGLAWMSLLMLIASFLPEQFAARIAIQKWFRPFASKGYSIYLWQGAAYSIAMFAGSQFGIPLPLVWLTAIVLTVGLGMAASPLESYRLYRVRG